MTTKKAPSRLLCVRIEDGLIDRLHKWRNEQDFVPTITATIQRAIEEFLEAHTPRGRSK